MTGTTKPSTQLAVVESDEKIAELESIAEQCAPASMALIASAMQRTFKVAAFARRLNELITDDMMDDIMALQGLATGFLTDTADDGKPKVYPRTVVKQITMEAIMKGLHMHGGEVYIIAGRLYAGQHGLERLCLQYPGVSHVKIDIGLPETRGAYTVVPCKASYALHGEVKIVDCMGARAIPIRVNKGMGTDAILGKAKRKLYARILEGISGIDHGLVESDEVEGEIIDVQVEPSAENDVLPDNYRDAIEAADSVSATGGLARQIGQDASLGPNAKKEGQALCADRANEIRGARGPGSNRPRHAGQDRMF